MIQIVAKRYLREGALSEYTEGAKELVDSSRQEEGCAGYGLYYDRERNLAVMLETWESQAHLDRHLARILAEGWPARLNAFADPDQKGGPEQFEKIY